MPRSKIKGETKESEPDDSKDKEDLDFLSPLLDDPHAEIVRLETELEHLRQTERFTTKKALAIEMELHTTRTDRDLYKRKFLESQTKLEQLTSTPFPVGVVEYIMPGGQNRVIVRLISGQSFVVAVPTEMKIKEGDNVALHQRSMSVVEVLPPIVDATIYAMEILEKPDENYDGIGGLQEQLTEIREVIELSLTDPEAFKIFNIKPPQGVLLYGPPGTGKTLIAKAVANATKANFLRLAAPELVQKFIGEGARLVREVFKIAREQAPAIIFIDEIDAIAARRMNDVQSGEREVNRTLMQLLAEMDGFVANDRVRIIAATNRIDILDPAILRPGRFDRLIELPLPNITGRRDILTIHAKKLPVESVNFDEIANKTDGFSGADLKAVCMEAAMFALRERLDGKKRNKIFHQDFLQAIEKIRSKKEQSPSKLSGNLYT